MASRRSWVDVIAARRSLLVISRKKIASLGNENDVAEEEKRECLGAFEKGSTLGAAIFLNMFIDSHYSKANR